MRTFMRGASTYQRTLDDRDAWCKERYRALRVALPELVHLEICIMIRKELMESPNKFLYIDCYGRDGVVQPIGISRLAKKMLSIRHAVDNIPEGMKSAGTPRIRCVRERKKFILQRAEEIWRSFPTITNSEICQRVYDEMLEMNFSFDELDGSEGQLPHLSILSVRSLMLGNPSIPRMHHNCPHTSPRGPQRRSQAIGESP